MPISGGLVRMPEYVMKFVGDDFYAQKNSDKPLEPRIYRRYYKLLIPEPDMPVMKFHGLRRTFVTRCVEVNCDYKTVSAILGCSDASITLDIYVHPDIGRKRKCIGCMLRVVR